LDSFAILAGLSDVTAILAGVRDGDPQAAEQLLPLLYDELRLLASRKLARESPGHTLQATALVHEVWLRLTGDSEKAWNSRAHFFGAAAEAMRRILVESARRKQRIRHGGGLERVSAEEIQIALPLPEEQLLAVSDALDALSAEAPDAAEVVKLRYFAGLTQEQVAEMKGISLRSAERQWTWAKSWLFRWIQANR
jgi:RNA polymerase sigma factor (TIGR02999 family)